MRKQFGLFVPISMSLLFLVSCGGTNSTPPVSDTTIAKDSTDTNAALGPKLTGYLDILWIPVASFKNLTNSKHRITFRFYVKDKHSLTLHGWSGDSDKYGGAPPDIMLSNGAASDSAEFGPGSYFGNLQLSKDGVKLINSIIDTSSYKSVLFVPLKASGNGGQITYDIILSDDPNPITKSSSFASTSTITSTNPSPPRDGK